MAQENISQEFKLKNLDEAKNYLIEEKYGNHKIVRSVEKIQKVKIHELQRQKNGRIISFIKLCRMQ